ncbi:Retrovirus-related Pol poly from transposon, partial [Paramuricea clavata]
MVVSAQLDGIPGEAYCGAVGPAGIERRTKEVIVGRTLVDLKQKNIPVRVVNLSSTRKKLSRGTEIAVCEPIACITPILASSSKEQKVTLDVDSIPEHLQDLYKKNVDGSGDIGRAKGTKNKINTGDAQPIKQAPRRLPMRKSDEAIQAVEEMEKQGIVEPSMSPWSSPIVLVRKKDGSTRFCVDYRRLNDITRKDSFPLPRVDITLDALNDAKWFTTLDLKSGYWQVELDPADKEKTAFSFGQGLWQFNAMLDEGISANPVKVEAVKAWPSPANTHQVRSFLVCAPITDDSTGVEHLISYFSRTLSGPEKKYCVTREELLAIVQATGHFHHYLYGNPFTIRNDHASLQWLLNFKNPEGQTARWLQKLQLYDFAVFQRRSKLHGNADALSRRPCEETGCKYCLEK